MTGESEKFRPIETAPGWSHKVFDTCVELAELLERHSYRFARTMPGAPHSYTLKRTWQSEDEFVEALRKMRAVERIEEFFKGYWYRRFNANGYKYWTMGASLDHILVNRAIHAPPFDPYAAIADSYDLAVHEKEADIERSKRVYDMLKIEPGTDILDIGCGTGTLIDFRFRHVRPVRYTGVDSQSGDARRLRRQASRTPRSDGPDAVRGLLAEARTEVRSRRGAIRRSVLYRRSRPCVQEGPVASQARRYGHPHVQQKEARRDGLLPATRHGESRRIR